MNEATVTYRKKVLFVCAQNKIRSVTAEKMFSDSQLYDVRSRGVAADARIRLTANDIGWADVIFVMEKNHRNRIVKNFRDAIGGKRIVCLFIEDIYEPMEDSLVTELRRKLSPFLLLPNHEKKIERQSVSTKDESPSRLGESP